MPTARLEAAECTAPATVEGTQLFSIVVAGNGRSGAYYALSFNVTGAGTRFRVGEGDSLANQATLQVAADRVHGQDYASGDAILTVDEARTAGTMSGTFIGPKGTTSLHVNWNCTSGAGGAPVV